jgi:hypothetical protein
MTRTSDSRNKGLGIGAIQDLGKLDASNLTQASRANRLRYVYDSSGKPGARARSFMDEGTELVGGETVAAESIVVVMSADWSQEEVRSDLAKVHSHRALGPGFLREVVDGLADLLLQEALKRLGKKPLDLVLMSTNPEQDEGLVPRSRRLYEKTRRADLFVSHLSKLGTESKAIGELKAALGRPGFNGVFVADGRGLANERSITGLSDGHLLEESVVEYQPAYLKAAQEAAMRSFALPDESERNSAHYTPVQVWVRDIYRHLVEIAIERQMIDPKVSIASSAMLSKGDVSDSEETEYSGENRDLFEHSLSSSEAAKKVYREIESRLADNFGVSFVFTKTNGGDVRIRNVGGTRAKTAVCMHWQSRLNRFKAEINLPVETCLKLGAGYAARNHSGKSLPTLASFSIPKESAALIACITQAVERTLSSSVGLKSDAPLASAVSAQPLSSDAPRLSTLSTRNKSSDSIGDEAVSEISRTNRSRYVYDSSGKPVVRARSFMDEGMDLIGGEAVATESIVILMSADWSAQEVYGDLAKVHSHRALAPGFLRSIVDGVADLLLQEALQRPGKKPLDIGLMATNPEQDEKLVPRSRRLYEKTRRADLFVSHLSKAGADSMAAGELKAALGRPGFGNVFVAHGRGVSGGWSFSGLPACNVLEDDSTASTAILMHAAKYECWSRLEGWTGRAFDTSKYTASQLWVRELYLAVRNVAIEREMIRHTIPPQWIGELEGLLQCAPNVGLHVGMRGMSVLVSKDGSAKGRGEAVAVVRLSGHGDMARVELGLSQSICTRLGARSASLNTSSSLLPTQATFLMPEDLDALGKCVRQAVEDFQLGNGPWIPEGLQKGAETDALLEWLSEAEWYKSDLDVSMYCPRKSEVRSLFERIAHKVGMSVLGRGNVVRVSPEVILKVADALGISPTKTSRMISQLPQRASGSGRLSSYLRTQRSKSLVDV